MIEGKADTSKVTFDLGDLGEVSFEIKGDADTLRIRQEYNGQYVRDITPCGGHVEDRTTATPPTGYELSTA